MNIPVTAATGLDFYSAFALLRAAALIRLDNEQAVLLHVGFERWVCLP